MQGPRASVVSNDVPWLQQMPQIPETLVMDKSMKGEDLRVSKTGVSWLVVLFAACCVATGLLVYFLAPCREHVAGAASQVTTWNCSGEKAGGSAYQPTEVPGVASTNPGDQEDPGNPGGPGSPATTEKSEEIGTKVPLPLPDARNLRLPRSTHPHQYNLRITPFLINNNFTFQGDITIILNVTELTRNITLHSNELKIKNESITLKNNNGTSLPIERLEFIKEFEFLVIHSTATIPPGQYSLHIEFAGILNDLLQGFYRSSHVKNDKTSWIAATQFQPTDARRAFPCFDEPALKAPFTVTIGRPNHMKSLSNMPRVKSQPMESVRNYTWDFYEKSTPMSTYLLAFIVSDFLPKSKGNFTIWARDDAINQTDYSLELGPAILQFYETFFGIPYPLPKMDMVALPDFSAGAMENWGLITYRESNLLYEDGVSTRNNKQSISIVIAHELAHQWFGNLVTPSWWTDLWLNEGFASYLEYIGTDAINPGWKMLDQFIINELQIVFSLDALKSSHQISIPVSNPDEINDIFDRISYAKGATIIRMMEHFLTTQVFKTALKTYLNERKYGSAQQDDLWEALTVEAQKVGVIDANLTVKEVMDTWTLQMGFPVVNVTRDYAKNEMVLQQTRFLMDYSDGHNNSSLWWIPISYTSPGKAINGTWMRREAKLVVNTTIPASDWLLLNVNQTGYYRVNYDDDNWGLIIAQLKKRAGHLVFDPKNRAQILDDALNLASSGYLNYEIAMNVTTYLTEEKEYVPWKAALRNLDYLHSMFIRSGEFDKMKKYLLHLITPLYIEVGFRDYPQDPLLSTYLRYEILYTACRMGHLDCINNAARQYQNWRMTPDPDKFNPISPNLKSIIYCTAIRQGGEEEWNFAWERYLRANVGSEKEILLDALACTRETWLLNKYLALAVTEGSGIRKQDASTVFSGVARNIVGENVAFKFLIGRFDDIKKYMGSSFMMLNGIIRSVTYSFNSEQDLEDLKQFSRKYKDDLSSSWRTINQAVERTEANIKWMQKYFAKITAWFNGFSRSNAGYYY